MKAVIRWFRAVWFAVWHPVVVEQKVQVYSLFHSDAIGAVRYAVAKTAADLSWHPTKDHDSKRREALEWAGHYARKHGVRLSAWETSFLVEWCVGERKGRL